MRHLKFTSTPALSKISVLLTLALLATGITAEAQTASTGASVVTLPTKPATATEQKGIDYLLAHQDASGAWLPQVGPGITAMVVRGLVQAGRPLNDPAIVKALGFIENCHQKDGGYYKDSNPNYNSAIVLSMFATIQSAWRAIPRKGAEMPYQTEVAGLQKFLISLQQDEKKKDDHGAVITRENPWYGGAGYGEDRPDLSNTSFMMEALHESGVPEGDAAMQKALLFVSRSQMNSETNSLAFARKATDGGFIYTPVFGGESKFGDIDRLEEGDSLLRSYGSMTYAGFKSMLYAGVTKNDPRIKAAVKWIQNNWTLEYNPGSGGSVDGQYYYLHTFAKAMAAWGEDSITDSKGVKHDWRAELVDFFTKNQRTDGSWVNAKSERWLEGNPVLPTAYAVLSLQEARK